MQRMRQFYLLLSAVFCCCRRTWTFKWWRTSFSIYKWRLMPCCLELRVPLPLPEMAVNCHMYVCCVATQDDMYVEAVMWVGYVVHLLTIMSMICGCTMNCNIIGGNWLSSSPSDKLSGCVYHIYWTGCEWMVNCKPVVSGFLSQNSQWLVLQHQSCALMRCCCAVLSTWWQAIMLACLSISHYNKTTFCEIVDTVCLIPWHCVSYLNSCEVVTCVKCWERLGRQSLCVSATLRQSSWSAITAQCSLCCYIQVCSMFFWPITSASDSE